MSIPFLTIFTPVYNRKDLIMKLYESIKNQSDIDFEWLIIDDGSTDGLEESILDLQKSETRFDIRYYYQNNCGKHVAINKALELSKGYMFFVVDSDDTLSKNCVTTLKRWENSIKNKEQFGGLSGLKGYTNDEMIGKTFNGDFLDITTLQQKKYEITGDRAEVFYLNILKKYRFPVFANEKFLTEKVLWNQLAHEGYKLRYFNEIIYIADYLDDGLTKSIYKQYRQSPKGYAYSILQDIDYYNYDKSKKKASYFHYYHDIKGSISLKECAKNLNLSFFELTMNLLEYRFILGMRRVKSLFKK